VIGCGIIGLTTAVTILSSQDVKYRVTIMAKDFPPNTTSNNAGAVWYPYLAAPVDKVSKWASETLDYLKREALNEESGVLLQKALEVFKTRPAEEPAWKCFVPSFRCATEEEIPNFLSYGYAVDGAVVDTDIYLQYLVEKVKKLGGSLVQRELKNLDEVLADYDVVINCSGLGARHLVGDLGVYPTRGQTILVKNKTHAHTIAFDDPNELSYIIPRKYTTVLGGTAQEGNWNTEPDEHDTRDILRKAALLSPEFSEVEILKVRVGLRPTRATVRVEPEWLHNGRKLVIHNYGHGGSGFTIGWGCSFDVLRLLNATLHEATVTSSPRMCA